MAEANRSRLIDSAPLRIRLEEAKRSNLARELYTNCFFHPEWLAAHAPVRDNDVMCVSCGGDEGYDAPGAPFCFGIHVVLNDDQWYGATLCANCHNRLLAELEPADESGRRE
jgi:hypothetical protein